MKEKSNSETIARTRAIPPSLLLVKCRRVAERFELWSSVKSCPNRQLGFSWSRVPSSAKLVNSQLGLSSLYSIIQEETNKNNGNHYTLKVDWISDLDINILQILLFLSFLFLQRL